MFARTFLFVCFTFSGVYAAPVPKVDERPPIKELPKELVQKWEAVGAELGWMELENEDGMISFTSEKHPKTAKNNCWIPAFLFKGIPLETLGKLPKPESPFGLYIGCTDITEVDFKEIKRFSMLCTLKFQESNTTLEGIGNLSELKFLTEINAEYCKMTIKGFGELNKLKNLRRLSIDGSGLEGEDWQPLKEMNLLEMLSLRSVKFNDTGMSFLAKLDKLTFLDLGEAEITDEGLKHLVGLNKLQSLQLSDNPITSAGIKHLAKLSQLTRLDVSYTKIDNAALKEISGLTKLSILYLNSCEISSEGINSLANLKKLQELSLENCPIDDKTAKLIGNYSELIFLNLSGSRVTDEGIKHLSGLKKLKSLDLSDTQINPKGLSHLKGFKLERLSLSKEICNDDTFPDYLNAIEVKTTLDLYRWKLTDKSIPLIAKYKDLETLELGRCSSLTQKGIAPLLELKKLKMLVLEERVVTEDLRKAISEALRGCKLEVVKGDDDPE